MKKSTTITILAIIILIILGLGVYFSANSTKKDNQPQNQSENEQNSQNNNIKQVKIETLKEGSGPEAKSGDEVVVNYTGTLENGTKFDSSLDRNEPFPFTLGQNRVIQGWEIGVLGMKVGEKRKLTIPPELGYGARAIGDIIPANSTLIFEVELLGINN